MHFSSFASALEQLFLADILERLIHQHLKSSRVPIFRSPGRGSFFIPSLASPILGLSWSSLRSNRTHNMQGLEARTALSYLRQESISDYHAVVPCATNACLIKALSALRILHYLPGYSIAEGKHATLTSPVGLSIVAAVEIV